MSVRGPTRQQKEFVDIYLKNRKRTRSKLLWTVALELKRWRC